MCSVWLCSSWAVAKASLLGLPPPQRGVGVVSFLLNESGIPSPPEVLSPYIDGNKNPGSLFRLFWEKDGRGFAYLVIMWREKSYLPYHLCWYAYGSGMGNVFFCGVWLEQNGGYWNIFCVSSCYFSGLLNREKRLLLELLLFTTVGPTFMNSPKQVASFFSSNLRIYEANRKPKAFITVSISRS